MELNWGFRDFEFVYSRMNLKMDSDKAKLFIGGISRDTTEDILKNHFTKYGDVLYSTVSLDRTTRIPRGFGFVTFSDISSAHEALQDTHVILGRTVCFSLSLFNFYLICLISQKYMKFVYFDLHCY